MTKDVNTKRLVQQFIAFAKIASPSRQEGLFASYLTKELAFLGFQTETDGAGKTINGNTGNLIATLPATGPGDPFMFCCHMDTVKPCENIEPIVNNDIIHTDGTTILSGDDKGGIAAILEGIRQVQEQNIPHGLIQVVFTIGEEIGMYGSKYLDYDKIKAKKAFILDAEGPLGTIVIQGPAKNVITAVIHGKTAHAGLYPEQGISAIQVGAQAISKMKLLRIDAETTANLGTISGGEATNIVADKLEIVAEARSLSKEKLDAQSQHMKGCFESAAHDAGAKADVKIKRSYAPFHLAPDTPVVLQTCAAMKRIGLEPKLASTNGGSDCNIFNAKGIAAVDLAIGMQDVHTKEESLHISDLETAARLIIAIIESN